MTVELALLSRVAYRDVEISAPRLRSLLALLAMDLGRGCSTTRLIEGLWPDQQPENPVKALQILVSRARAQIGADVIVSTPTTYRLALAEDAVDAASVLRAATTSAQRARAGDHLAALESATTAIEMWAGPPTDEEGEDPLAALRRDRAATYASLWRVRALALARLGRYAEAFEPLVELHERRPRDEEVLLELLRCEAATAGESAALTRYEGYRLSLRDELGTDPGAPLQELHQGLLQERPPPVRRGIVQEPNPLLGRANDVAAVVELIRSARVTSIVGPGGLGKTRLAHAVAREVEHSVVHFVPLAGAAADVDVVREVASFLGVGESRRTAPWMTDAIGGIAGTVGNGLLILDNCEHLIDGVATLVRDLVSVSADLRVLATSRAPLGLSSESVYLLPELGLSTATQLFVERARAARPDVELPSSAVEEVCRQLDGLPLAIELAAARTRVMAVADIARRLNDRFALLRGSTRDAPERHQTLHAVVEWSWQLLDPAAQSAMRALSTFPGGFTADAATYLVGDTSVLEVLVEQSLLKVADKPTGTRFSMLETVREFSARALSDAGERDRAVDGMLAWTRAFGAAHHDGFLGADPFSTVAHLRAEHDNLAQALRYALDNADGASIAAAAAALLSLWVIESNYPRILQLSTTIADVLPHYRPAPEDADVARTALTLCAMYSFAIEGRRPSRILVALRRLPTAPPDTVPRAVASVLIDEPDPGDSPLFAAVANTLSSYQWESSGDLDRAADAAHRVVESLAGQDSPWLEAMARARVAELSLQLDDPAEVRRQLGRSLPVLERLRAWGDAVGLRWGMVLAELHLGDTAAAQRWADSVTSDLAPEKVGTQGYDLAVRAELSFAQGDVETGLRRWRGVLERLNDSNVAESWGVVPSRDPWVMEASAVAVVAHARHGQLDLVSPTVETVAAQALELLAEPLENPPPYLMELTLAGTLLVALGMANLSATSTAPVGVRMIVLAERMRYLRNFRPTMTADRVRAAAEEADAATYADAVSTYAALDRSELRAEALDLLASASDRD